MASTTAEEVDDAQEVIEDSHCDGENGELGKLCDTIYSVSIQCY